MSFRLPDDGVIVVDTPDADALLARIETRLAEGEGFAVATLNLDHLAKLRLSPAFREAYARHTHVVADGNPVVWLSRLAGRPVALTPGSDLVEPLAALAARRGVPMALLGANSETLETAAARLEGAYPGLSVVARVAPPYGLDPNGPEAADCLEQVRASGARLCLLALGAPKQEMLAARARDLAPGCGFVSIGAGLDFIARSQTRAPLWMRRLALEWLWRLAREPRRLTRRYLDGLRILPGLTLDALRLRRATRAGDALGT